MRARRRCLDAPARARHAAACPGRRARILPATRSRGSPTGSVSRSPDRHSALGDAATRRASSSRCCRGCARAASARWRRPSGLPGADRGDRQAAPGRLGTSRSEAPAPLDAERSLQRIDSYPYRHRVRDVMSAPAEFVARRHVVGDALARMADERISSLSSASQAGEQLPLPAETGIVTERDVMRRWPARRRRAWHAGREHRHPSAGHGAGGGVRLSCDRPHEPAQDPPSGCDDETAASSAHCRPATCCGCAPRGSSRSATRSSRPPTCTRSAAPGPSCRASPRALLAEGLSGREIAALISHQVGALTRQAAVLAEQRMREDGQGSRRAPMRSPCSAPPAAARACWPWTRTTP